MEKAKGVSIASKGLNYKLTIAFCLMSVLPVLVLLYLVVYYILPQTGFKPDIILFTAITIFIALIGFFLIKEVFVRVMSVSAEAKLIASGNIGGQAEMGHVDEVGVLGQTLNQLTQHIRSNMEELKSYSHKTEEINLKIQEHVLVFSNLLQISSLISQAVILDDVLRLATEKSRLLAHSDIAYLLFREEGADSFYMRCADAVNPVYLTKIKIESEDFLFGKTIKNGKPLLIDKDNSLSDNANELFLEKFKVKNTLALPVFLKDRIIAVLGIGNSKEEFAYSKDDAELLDIFTKQIAIAVENNRLVRRVEKLEIKDTLTGLYNKTYIVGRLQEEIKRAVVRQRPCAFILFNIDDFQKFRDKAQAVEVETVLKTVGALLRDSVTEIDRVARFGDNEFAVVLPERNKRQAHEIAERVRKLVEISFTQEPDESRRLTISAGVSENPLDGITAEELLLKAKQLLDTAKAQGKNRSLV
ncbi:MAG: sensor domain-containing diguanylate cyclase [Candidatus Omnitrophica bacterium]|nr:sensor domain-containing diguanylate cyclase [Candidatus Omnitrophota bacterium]